MLTGGKTAKEIYKYWAASSTFRKLSNIDFFLTDERCVSIESTMSNAGMIRNTLFSNGIPTGCNFYAPIQSDIDINGQVLRYENKIPREIDVIILSVGEDGHIASIFPGEKAFLENKRYFIESSSPIPPLSRVTLTYPAILNARKIYILAVTDSKKKLLKLVKKNKYQCDCIPVKRVIHGKWITEKNIKKAADILLQSIMFEIK